MSASMMHGEMDGMMDVPSRGPHILHFFPQHAEIEWLVPDKDRDARVVLLLVILLKLFNGVEPLEGSHEAEALCTR